VDVRDSANPVLASARRWLDRVNARHLWNHDEHFHGWILRNLPARRRAAVDVGCGTGVLAGKLAPHFARVTGIDRDSQGIAGVRTSRGSFPSRVVVNAAGAWAAEVAALAGVQLPVEPLRRTLVPTESFDRISHDVPMTVDMATGFHFRPEGLGFLMAWNDPAETLGFKLGVDRGFIEKVLALAADRVPVFAEAEVNPSRAWSGLYEVTPDHHPILGPVPQVPGLFLANGFSGHGVMHSPATGKILADLILEGRTSLTDVRQFDLARFPEGRLVEDTLVL